MTSNCYSCIVYGTRILIHVQNENLTGAVGSDTFCHSLQAAISELLVTPSTEETEVLEHTPAGPVLLSWLKHLKFFFSLSIPNVLPPSKPSHRKDWKLVQSGVSIKTLQKSPNTQRSLHPQAKAAVDSPQWQTIPMNELESLGNKPGMGGEQSSSEMDGGIHWGFSNKERKL